MLISQNQLQRLIKSMINETATVSSKEIKKKRERYGVTSTYLDDMAVEVDERISKLLSKDMSRDDFQKYNGFMPNESKGLKYFVLILSEDEDYLPGDYETKVEHALRPYLQAKLSSDNPNSKISMEYSHSKYDKNRPFKHVAVEAGRKITKNDSQSAGLIRVVELDVEKFKQIILKSNEQDIVFDSIDFSSSKNRVKPTTNKVKGQEVENLRYRGDEERPVRPNNKKQFLKKLQELGLENKAGKLARPIKAEDDALIMENFKRQDGYPDMEVLSLVRRVLGSYSAGRTDRRLFITVVEMDSDNADIIAARAVMAERNILNYYMELFVENTPGNIDASIEFGDSNKPGDVKIVADSGKEENDPVFFAIVGISENKIIEYIEENNPGLNRPTDLKVQSKETQEKAIPSSKTQTQKKSVEKPQEDEKEPQEDEEELDYTNIDLKDLSDEDKEKVKKLRQQLEDLGIEF